MLVVRMIPAQVQEVSSCCSDGYAEHDSYLDVDVLHGWYIFILLYNSVNRTFLICIFVLPNYISQFFLILPNALLDLYLSDTFLRLSSF